MIIDSQIHAFAPNTPERPWAVVPEGWVASATGEQMVADMDRLGIDGAIYVSPFNLYSYDTSYAIGVQRAYPGRFGLVTRVDFDKPDAAEKVLDWKKVPGAVGLRLGMAPGCDVVPGIDQEGAETHPAILIRHSPSVDASLRRSCPPEAGYWRASAARASSSSPIV